MAVEVIRVTDRRFNHAVARPFAARMAAAWERGATLVALDFTEVVTMDSLGIAALVAAYRARPPGARIVLCGLNDYVRDVLEITQMFRFFDAYATAAAVLLAAAA